MEIGLFKMDWRSDRISEERVYKSFIVAITMGIVLCFMGTFLSVDQVIKRADDALYRAKENGRNRVEKA